MSTIDLAKSIAGTTTSQTAAPATSTRYGTVQAAASAGGNATVLIDGSDQTVALPTSTAVAANERVTVVYDGGSYRLVALDSVAAGIAESARTASNYLGYDAANGLVVSESGGTSPTGGNTQIVATGVNLRKGSNNILAISADNDTDARISTGYTGTLIIESSTSSSIALGDGSVKISSYDGLVYKNSATSSAVPTSASTMRMVGCRQLWSGSVGTGSTITLSTTCSQFVCVDIEYVIGSTTQTARLYAPNGKSTAINRIAADGSKWYVECMTLTFSGTTVTTKFGAAYSLNTSFVHGSESSAMKITKIVGWC